ncbi:pyrroline-5-carboxylate reductase family protein, partial [Nocardioides sp.]|uniref:pyrroline-5-carboxylate reductase family protein n=1 Tax=Nocardioides sp. TaxID=35761 RepID=UPI002C7FEC60
SLMLRETGEHPAVLRENVTSPGGTTAAALRVLENAGLRGTLLDATRANRDRSWEIARGEL